MTPHQSNLYYLASPYSDPANYVREMRYRLAMEATAWLLQKGYNVISPIVHCHVMAFEHRMPTDAKWWQNYNTALIERCTGIIVLKIAGWEESKGVIQEITLANSLQKQLVFVEHLNPPPSYFESGKFKIEGTKDDNNID